MTTVGFTIIPNVVYDAQERGIITPEMADCLSLLYRWREHDSNVVREVSAERLKKWLSLLRPEYNAAEKKWPTAETVRRWMRGLREAGWFTCDYKTGVERPYNVFLKNLGCYHINFVEHAQGRPEGCAQGRAETEKKARAQNDVSLSEIKHWKQTVAYQGRANESTFLSNEERGEACPFGADKDAKDQCPSAAIAAGLRPAAAAGTIESPPSLFTPSAPAGGTAQMPPGLENPPQSKATTAGKRKLLKAMYEVVAQELKNSHAAPATLKPRFDLIEAAHGFEAVVADFEKWCRENFDRHPEFPLVDYVKVVDDRLGIPSVPDEQPAFSDNKQVMKIMTYVYNQVGWPPPPAKVADLIATYGFADVNGAVRHHLDFACKRDADDVRNAKQFFSEGGALIIITDYRKEYRKKVIALMMQAGCTKADAAALYDSTEPLRRREWAWQLNEAIGRMAKSENKS